MTTHLTVERAETLELLQRDVRHLERALSQAGLDSRDGNLTFSLKDHGPGQHSHSDESLNPEAEEHKANETEEEPLPVSQMYLALARGGVDIPI